MGPDYAYRFPTKLETLLISAEIVDCKLQVARIWSWSIIID